MIYLKEISIDNSNHKNYYPFNVPLIKNLNSFTFRNSITILVGNNGTGKSAFLKSLACSINAIAIGENNLQNDPTLRYERELSNSIKASWTKRNNYGFFFRADDYINFHRSLSQTREEMFHEISRVDKEYINRSDYSKSLAKMPFLGSINAINSQYGEDFEAKSHGEGFLNFFQARLKPNSIYILDEPEVPLSTLNQLTFIGMVNEMVKENCQFIIATHSPIVMALPNSDIYELVDGKFHNVNYEDIESVNFLKAFLSDPKRYLRYL